MGNNFILMQLTVFFLISVMSVAQEESPVKIVQLTDQIYQLSTDQGSYTTNSLIFVGDDGLLIVDTQSKSDAEEFRKVVDSFGKGTPKYIINTHRHVEHIGGNALFGKLPIVIGHDLIRTKLKQGSYIFDEYPEETYPDITLTDSLNLYFNGEKIRIIALAGCHDDNEIIVHFTKSKVVHLSSLVNGINFPSVDSDGDVLRFAELVGKAIELLPEDVTIVSGHNSNCSWDDLHRYRDMIIKTTEIVKQALADGKDVETMQKEKILSDWDSFAGSYVSTDDWISYLAQGLSEQEKPKKKIYEPLYYALKDNGIDAAIDLYYDLSNNHADEYDFQGVHLLVIGDKLLDRGKPKEAIRFLDLALDRFPDDKYAYYTCYTMSQAYKEIGDIKQAKKSCEKSLELKPDFQAGAKLLDELKKL